MKRLLFLLLIFSVVLFPQQSNASTSYEYQVGTGINTTNPDQNVQENSILYFGKDDSGEGQVLLKFPFTPSKLNTLTIKSYCHHGNGTYTANIKPILSDYTYNTVTWNTKPTLGSSIATINCDNDHLLQTSVITDLTNSNLWYGIAFTSDLNNYGAILFYDSYDVEIIYDLDTDLKQVILQTTMGSALTGFKNSSFSVLATVLGLAIAYLITATLVKRGLSWFMDIQNDKFTDRYYHDKGAYAYRKGKKWRVSNNKGGYTDT